MKDHRKNFSFAIAIMTMLMFVSCTPEAMFDGNFNLQISVINQSDAELVIERHDVSGDFVVKKNIPVSENESGLYLGEYCGNKKDDYPPDDVVLQEIQNIRIYRDMDGSQQELPRTCFNRLSAFEVNKDYWFDICTITYKIIVTENMFTE